VVWKKQNLTQQKHTFTNQKKCTTTQNKHKKTKAKFSRLLQHPAWKRTILVLALHKLVTYWLRHLLIYLQPGPTWGNTVMNSVRHNCLKPARYAASTIDAVDRVWLSTTKNRMSAVYSHIRHTKTIRIHDQLNQWGATSHYRNYNLFNSPLSTTILVSWHQKRALTHSLPTFMAIIQCL